MPTYKSNTKKIPKDGWVRELEDAESAARTIRSAGAQLRLAIAAYKLRDFKILKIAANLGLALDPSEDEKELLKEYVEKSKEQKEIELSAISCTFCVVPAVTALTAIPSPFVQKPPPFYIAQ